jgi:hypothetical protein
LALRAQGFSLPGRERVAEERYSFGRYFSPLHPNRPTDNESLVGDNDVALYDRLEDPGEVHNLALDASRQDLLAENSAKLERLISEEIGEDRHT